MTTESKSESGFWTSGRVLALLFAIALVLRAAASLTRHMIQLDETAYVRMAENLAAGNGLSDISGLTATHFSPLLPFFIAGVAVVLRNYVISAYVVVIVFGSLLIIPTYLLGKELVNERVGLAAAALMMVTPLFVDYSSRIYTESVYIFFLLLSIVFARHMLRGCRIPCGTLAGAALGLAYLANPSAVYYFVAVIALAVIVGLYRGIWRQMAKALVFFIIFFGIYAVPYLIFLHAELGQWTYSGKIPGNIYASVHNLRSNTLDWEKDLLSLTDDNQEVKILRLEEKDDPASFFIHQPIQAAKVFAKQSQILYNEELSKVMPLWLLPLLGLGLFARGWSRLRAASVGYLLVMMAPALLILSMYAHSRFFMPFVPMAMLWVAEGWLKLDEWGDETIGLSFDQRYQAPWRRWLPWIIGALILLPMLANAALVVRQQDYPLGYRDAGQIIKARDGEGKRIMSREFSAAYYSGGTAVTLPYAAYDRTTEYARLKDVDYLVIGKEELATWRPTLDRLSAADSSHPEWVLVDRARPNTGQETLIFKLVK